MCSSDLKRIWVLAAGIHTVAVPTFTPAWSLIEQWVFEPSALEPHEWTGIVVQLIVQLIVPLVHDHSEDHALI